VHSLHGLVRGENMELGRDSDTGGQVSVDFLICSRVLRCSLLRIVSSLKLESYPEFWFLTHDDIKLVHEGELYIGRSN
jgi:hypothetical protein